MSALLKLKTSILAVILYHVIHVVLYDMVCILANNWQYVIWLSNSYWKAFISYDLDSYVSYINPIFHIPLKKDFIIKILLNCWIMLVKSTECRCLDALLRFGGVILVGVCWDLSMLMNLAILKYWLGSLLLGPSFLSPSKGNRFSYTNINLRLLNHVSDNYLWTT